MAVDKTTSSNNKVKKLNKECKNDIYLMIMLKNEKLRITVTMDSCKNFVKGFFVLDTGSTDGTQDIVRNYCKEHNIKLYMKESPFTNFRDSRNELITFAENELKTLGYDSSIANKEAPFFLLLDCNDELQGGEHMVKLIKQKGHDIYGLNVKQMWKSSASTDTFYYPRFIKAFHKWTYKRLVHEYVSSDLIEEKKISQTEVFELCPKVDSMILFQDRTKDGDSSFKRFSRDKKILHGEYLKDQKDSRTLFYLAQSFACLGEFENAYRFYRFRTKETGFIEELYQSFVRLGNLGSELKHSKYETIQYYFQAIYNFNRVEPMVLLTSMYYVPVDPKLEKTKWHVANLFSSFACSLTFPNCVLFVNKTDYEYNRWHNDSIVSFYNSNIKKDEDNLKDVKEKCKKAIDAKNAEVDKKNMSFYDSFKVPPYTSRKFEDVKIFNKCIEFKTDQTNSRIKNLHEYDFWKNELIKYDVHEDFKDPLYNLHLKFFAYFKLGEVSESLNYDWSESFIWYWKAFELLPRVEPLIKLAEHYIHKQQQYPVGYMLMTYACKLEYPESALLINKDHYEYTRYHLLSIAAYHYGLMEPGKNNIYECRDILPSRVLELGNKCCLKACKKGQQVDKKNLEFYIELKKKKRF